jgi:sarcosine oxidase
LKFDVLVIGGGVNGLSTSYQLSKHAGLKIGLVEQFSLGHAHGSSHGFSRIFRTTYKNPVYRKLAKHAQMHEWPALEKDIGCRLIHPNPRCAFGLESAVEAWACTILESHPSAEIELLQASRARQLFPQFRFSSSLRVVQDHSSGVIAAKDTMENLAKILVQNKVKILEDTKVLSINTDSNKIQIETNKGVLSSERLVITAGPWIRQFSSEINSPFCPIKQVVGYFKLQGAKELYQLGQFPNWVYFGEGENSDFYGLPEFGCEGIKISQEISVGEMGNPDERTAEVDPSRKKALRDFVSEQFVAPIERLVGVETCFYTNTPTSDFVLDLLPHDPRIAIGSACSGHAFKFAPLTGRILAELVLNGKTTVSEFEDNRELFSVKAFSVTGDR